MKAATKRIIATVTSGVEIIRVPMGHKKWINTQTSKAVPSKSIEAAMDEGFIKAVKVEGSINRWKIEVTEKGKTQA